jgi:hypothetical protein
MDDVKPRLGLGCGSGSFFIGILLLAGLVVWVCYRTYPKPGQHFVLTAQPPDKLVDVMVDKQAALDFRKFTVAGDAVGLKQLLAGGKVRRVPVGMSVLIIDHDWINSLYEVRVMSGASAGASGWVVRQSLQEAR